MQINGQNLAKVSSAGADGIPKYLAPSPISPFAMQILSFLSEIGDALNKQSVSDMGPTWDIARIVNYHEGLGRMTLTPPAGADETQWRGVIFLQTYELADGSLCLKANLGWQGNERYSTITVYSKPGLNWRKETAQIASAWLAGPPVASVTMSEVSPIEGDPELKRLMAMGR